jgi:hypothetical protein
VPCEQVGRQEHLALAPLELAKVDPLAVELHAPAAERGDLSDRDEQVPALDPHDDPDDDGMGVGPEPGHDVLDAADPVALAVDQGALDDGGEMEEVECHGACSSDRPDRQRLPRRSRHGLRRCAAPR